MRRKIVDAAVLAILSVLWCRKVAALWWTFDDPFHLNLIRERTAADLLFSSAFWRAFPSHVFTPLLLLSLKLDLQLFGLNARAFYIHQIISFACVAPLVYLLLREWIAPIPAMCGALIAVAGVPMIEVTQRLMDRHYIEGLILALLATLLFVRQRYIPSAALYLAAMLAKEIFVPLIVLLLVLGAPASSPAAAGRRRASRRDGGVPLAIALVVYVVWRVAMLGPRLESYGWAVRPGGWPRVIATLPWRMLIVLAHGRAVGWIALALLGVAVILAARSRPWLAVAGACAAILPIVPVSFEIQARYALATWLLAAIAVAFMRIRFAPIVVLLAVVVAARGQWADSYRLQKRMSNEARVFSMIGPGDVLWLPATPPATLPELVRLTGSPARWTYDAVPLCAGRLAAQRFFAYVKPHVREVGREEVMRDCAANRVAPLTVDFAATRGNLFWDFGPYDAGTYRVVIADGRQGFDVPRAAGFQLGGVPALPLRIRYQSPAGWVTYSDDLTVSLAEGSNVSWHR